ncbi:lipopolysaccharide-induced tumor necrosis factor-alpha factor homolog [Aphomia sociella]
MESSGKGAEVSNDPQPIYPQINPPPYPGPASSLPPHGTVVYQQPVPTATVMTVTPGIVSGVVVGQQMGPQPTTTTCKSCNQMMVTRVQQTTTMRTHMMALLLCVFGCWPCVCIPYCMDSCMNVDHYCTNCGAYIGTYQN